MLFCGYCEADHPGEICPLTTEAGTMYIADFVDGEIREFGSSY